MNINEWTELQAEAEQTGQSILTFATRSDAIEQEIAPALTDWTGDYDLDAIFEATFEYVTIVDEDGVQHGDGFFMQTVDDAAFWASVEANEITKEA